MRKLFVFTLLFALLFADTLDKNTPKELKEKKSTKHSQHHKNHHKNHHEQTTTIEPTFPTSTTTSTSTTSTTATATTTTSLTDLSLCLVLKSIELTDMKWSKQSEYSSTKGIFYVYANNEGVNTEETMRYISFDITQDIMNQNESLPTIFTFEGDDQNLPCWVQPTFGDLKIRFKIYQFYHTALKSEGIIQIPLISFSSKEYDITLTSIPYQYESPVLIDFTLNWQQNIVKESGEIPYQSDASQTSDELIDDIVAPNDIPDDGIDNPDDDNSNNNSSSGASVMVIAAICSSILGLSILIYICFWANKQYKRRDYSSIHQTDNGFFSPKDKLKIFKRISLRNNVSVNNEKTVMHPSSSSSYTFDD